MSTQPRIGQIAATGASDGDVPIYDAATGRLVMGPAGGSGGDVGTDPIWDAAGDLAVGSGSDAASRFPVGTPGQVLTVDLAEALKLRWVTPSGSGGGGGISAYPPGSADIPPGSPNAKDDEFDGTSVATWVDGPFALTSFVIDTTRDSHVVARANGLGNQWNAKYQTAPGAYPYTATAKLAGSNLRGNNQSFGLCLAPASPTSTSKVLIAGIQSAGNTFIQRLLWSNHTTGFTSSAVADSEAHGGNMKDPCPIYVRITVNSATSVDVSFSRDGWNFVATDTGTNPGFTPGVIGLGLSEFGTPDLTAHFDWFRVT